MNVIAWLEYELAYYDSAVHRFNHYTTRIPPMKNGVRWISYDIKNEKWGWVDLIWHQNEKWGQVDLIWHQKWKMGLGGSRMTSYVTFHLKEFELGKFSILGLAFLPCFSCISVFKACRLYRLWYIVQFFRILSFQISRLLVPGHHIQLQILFISSNLLFKNHWTYCCRSEIKNQA